MPVRPKYHTPKTQADSARSYEGRAGRLADKRFYASARWLRLRATKLLHDPLCEPCQAAGRVTPAEQVHHVRDRKPHPELAFVWENLESVCVPCHNAKRSKG